MSNRDPAFTSDPAIGIPVHYSVHDSAADTERAACGAEAIILNLTQGWDRVTCPRCWERPPARVEHRDAVMHHCVYSSDTDKVGSAACGADANDSSLTDGWARVTCAGCLTDAPSAVTPAEMIDVVLQPMSDLIQDALRAAIAAPAAILPGGGGDLEVIPPRPARRRLPDERQSVTRHFRLPLPQDPLNSGPPVLDVYVQVGLYGDGGPGEVFIAASKQGSFTSGALDCMAKMTSLALQYGAPIGDVVRQLRGTRFEPAGWVTSAGEGHAVTSVADMIARWLEAKFCPAREAV